MISRSNLYQFAGGLLGILLLDYLSIYSILGEYPTYSDNPQWGVSSDEILNNFMRDYNLTWMHMAYIIGADMFGVLGGIAIGERIATGRWNDAVLRSRESINLLPNPGPNALRAAALHIENIPDEMMCILSGEIMTDPVYFDGRPNAVFERAWIERALSLKSIDPYTRIPASIDQLKPNVELQNRTNDFLTQEENKYKKAATPIQSHYRGYFARKKIRAAVNPQEADKSENKFQM